MGNIDILEATKIGASILGASVAIIVSLVVYIWHNAIKHNDENQKRDEKSRKQMKEEIERHVDFRVETFRSDVSRQGEHIEEIFSRTDKIGADMMGVKQCIKSHKKLCDERHRQ